MSPDRPFPRVLTVRGLLGTINEVSVPLRLEERITLLTGPNGSGKTHVLRLTQAAMAVDLRALAVLQFGAIRLDYADGSSLEVVRAEAANPADAVRLVLKGFDEQGELIDEHPEVVVDDLEDLLPDYLRAAGPDVWEDIRDGELLSVHELAARYRLPAERVAAYRYGEKTTGTESPGWLNRFRHDPPPTLIETGRLDIARVRLAPVRGRRTATPQHRRSQIEIYVDRIEAEMNDARRESLAVSQRKDREFAERALDKARAAVQEGAIRARYDELSTLHQELFDNGLTAEAMTVEFPGERTNPTERRILDLFLDDWEAKLAPLRPVHDKLQILRSIVDEKMSSKSVDLRRGHLTFLDRSGAAIPLESLSSGEQHLVALFTMLLFSAPDHSVVLIDEPEISMHAAWKHAFLDDIRRVAAIRDLQVIAATHSSAIINGEWELVEELTQVS